MLTSMIMQMVLVGMTHAPATLDLQTNQDAQLTKCSAEQTYTVAYDPIHGPDPNREMHDYLPGNSPDPYGGRTSNGADPYGGRYGGNDPYGGKTGNGLSPYGR